VGLVETSTGWGRFSSVFGAETTGFEL